MFCWIELASFPGAKFAIIIYPETDFFVFFRPAGRCWTHSHFLLDTLDVAGRFAERAGRRKQIKD